MISGNGGPPVIPKAAIAAEMQQGVRRQTPFLELDVGVAIRQARHFAAALPEVATFFAVKSNGHAQLARAFDQLGLGFEVASAAEAQRLVGLGVSADRIIYCNPVKPPSHIREAVDLGVNCFSFDSHREIAKLADLAPRSRLLLRVAVSDHGSAFPLSSKFGCHPSEARELVEHARHRGLCVEALTFHVGSQCESLPTWRRAIEQCGIIMRELHADGTEITIIDIGGGFPVTYIDEVPSIDEIAIAIREAVHEHVPYEVQLWAEPGRYLSAPAGQLTAEIIGRATRQGREWLYIDVGVFQGLMECLQIDGWQYPVSRVSDERSTERTVFTVTGPTCDAFDTMFTSLELPSDLEPGDTITFGMVGAYALEYGSSFNGFEVPQIRVLDAGEAEVHA